LIDELRKITGKDIEPRYEPARPGEVVHSHADVSRAMSELGYRPSVGLEEGLRMTAEFFESQRDSVLH
jgi:nucleoside-diphosphate-sugar epimerase